MGIIEQIRDGAGETLSPADAGGKGHPRGYLVEPDRERAIQQSILSSVAGDTVLIAGKGHETYQVMGERTIPFDDRDVARRVLEAEEKNGSFDSMENSGSP
jgi:UDP-N-acetylmuramyl tripeptide synthase